MAVIFTDGFESGDFAAWSGISGAGTAVVAGAAHAGTVGARISCDGSYAYVDTGILGVGTAVLVGQMWFRFSTIPTTDPSILSVGNAASTFHCLFFRRTADGVLVAYLNGDTQDTSLTPLVDVWYRLDWRLNWSANPWLLEWTIDGGSTESLGHAEAARQTNRFTISAEFARTGVLDVDQVKLSVTSGDFPLAANSTVSLVAAATLGALAGTAVMGRTVHLTATGALGALAGSAAATRTVHATTTATLGALSAAGTMAGAVSTATPGWYGLLALHEEIRDIYAQQRDLVPSACPNDGEPLRAGPGGVLTCTFDGWQYPRDYARPF